MAIGMEISMQWDCLLAMYSLTCDWLFSAYSLALNFFMCWILPTCSHHTHTLSDVTLLIFHDFFKSNTNKLISSVFRRSIDCLFICCVLQRYIIPTTDIQNMHSSLLYKCPWMWLVKKNINASPEVPGWGSSLRKGTHIVLLRPLPAPHQPHSKLHHH